MSYETVSEVAIGLDPSTMTDGTVLLPSVTFASDPNTGLYLSAADTLGISAGGVAVATYATAAVNVIKPLNVSDNAAPTVGTAVYGSVYKKVADDGLYWQTFGSGEVNLVGGAAILYPIGAPLGAVGAPSYSFAGDGDTGIFSAGANTLNLVAGGTTILYVDATGVTTSSEIYAPDGAVGTPAYNFASDVDSGIYRIGANNVGIGVGGSLVLSVAATNITSVQPILAPAGAVGTPALSFSTDTNSGIYSGGADTVVLGTGGVARTTWTTAAITNTIPMSMSSQKITSLANPAAGGDAVNLTYLAANYLALAGGTMAADIAMGDNDLTGVGDITMGETLTIDHTYSALAPHGKLFIDASLQTDSATHPLIQITKYNGGATFNLLLADGTLSPDKLLFQGDAAFATTIKDEDNMVTDSATALCTQQSIKAYTDTSVRVNTVTTLNAANLLMTTEEYVEITYVGGAVTITLTAAATNQGRTYKFFSSTAESITIQRQGLDTIDGAVSVALAQNAYTEILCATTSRWTQVV